MLIDRVSCFYCVPCAHVSVSQPLRLSASQCLGVTLSLRRPFALLQWRFCLRPSGIRKRFTAVRRPQPFLGPGGLRLLFSVQLQNRCAFAIAIFFTLLPVVCRSERYVSFYKSRVLCHDFFENFLGFGDFSKRQLNVGQEI